MTIDTPRRLLPALAGALLLLLGACGGAAPDLAPRATTSASPAGSTLAIATQELPAGRCGETYPAVRLAASGAEGPVVFSIASGALPAGLRLEADGRLHGVPSDHGHFDVTFAVADATAESTRPLDVEILPEGFTLRVRDLPLAGEAWSGEPVRLEALGALGDVRFEIVESDSRGILRAVDAAAGTATWVPGDLVRGGTDVLRATDEATGASDQIALGVMPHPAPHRIAAFGHSDVWYVDFDQRFGPHGLPRDFDHVLASLGLRPAALGTDGERRAAALADFYVRERVLAHLNVYFGRDADGTLGTGLPITFPLRRPDAAYAAPSAGGLLSGAEHRYSVMGIVHGTSNSIVGAAFLDGVGNAMHENDTTSPQVGELGVFANQILNLFNTTYLNQELRTEPIDAADVEALRALVYGLPHAGGRQDEIERIGDGFGRTLAAVLAHEIGHSLGLRHTNPYVDGSIMNASLWISPRTTYAFLPEDLMQLQGALPGVGRLGIAAAKIATANEPAPAGGLEICNLVLRPHPEAPATTSCGCGCAHE